MDWYTQRNPFVSPNGFSDFAYDNNSESDCIVLQKYDVQPGDSLELDNIILESDEDWEEFKSAPIFPSARRDNGVKGKPPGRGNDDEVTVLPPWDLPSGVCVLLCPRAEEVFTGIPANLSDLAMSESNWRKIATTFRLPSNLGKALKHKTTKVSSTAHKITESREEGGKKSSYVEYLDMHSMVTSDEFPDNFALASTHFNKRKLTFVVILGASFWELERTKELLEQAEDAIDHPLLGLGLCAELQFERDKRLVENTVDECIEITTELERALQDQDEVSVQLINKVRERQFAATGIIEELRAIKRHMSKAFPHRSNGNVRNGKRNEGKAEAEEGDAEGSDEEGEQKEPSSLRESVEKTDDKVTDRFYQRFKDILVEYDALESKSQRYANNMSVTSDIIRAESARREAKVSTVLAFVAMLYLPMTTLATIFAMPVFNFQNHWLDWRFHFNNLAGVGNRDSNSNADDNPRPVLSGYFWIYLVIATTLTTITVEGWYRFTIRQQHTTHWLINLAINILEAVWSKILGLVQFLVRVLKALRSCCGTETVKQSPPNHKTAALPAHHNDPDQDPDPESPNHHLPSSSAKQPVTTPPSPASPPQSKKNHSLSSPTAPSSVLGNKVKDSPAGIELKSVSSNSRSTITTLVNSAHGSLGKRSIDHHQPGLPLVQPQTLRARNPAKEQTIEQEMSRSRLRDGSDMV